MYNYEMTTFPSEERPGASVFYKNDNGEIFHTYSSYGRGRRYADRHLHHARPGTEGPRRGKVWRGVAWVRHHDRYDGAAVNPRAQYEQPKSSAASCFRLEFPSTEFPATKFLQPSTKSTMKLYGFPPSPNTWKVRALAAHLGVPLDLNHRSQQGRAEYAPLIWRSTRPGARRSGRRRFQAVGVECDPAIYRRQKREFAVAERCANTRRHRALAILATRPLGRRGMPAADVPAPGEEDIEPRSARRSRHRQGHRGLQQRGENARRACWPNSRIWSART